MAAERGLKAADVQIEIVATARLVDARLTVLALPGQHGLAKLR
jgi:hypothetical protein